MSKEVGQAPPTKVDTDDIFAGLASAARAQSVAKETAPLKIPPKWLRRPCGARFAVSIHYSGIYNGSVWSHSLWPSSRKCGTGGEGTVLKF